MQDYPTTNSVSGVNCLPLPLGLHVPPLRLKHGRTHARTHLRMHSLALNAALVAASCDMCTCIYNYTPRISVHVFSDGNTCTENLLFLGECEDIVKLQDGEMVVKTKSPTLKKLDHEILIAVLSPSLSVYYCSEDIYVHH